MPADDKVQFSTIYPGGVRICKEKPFQEVESWNGLVCSSCGMLKVYWDANSESAISWERGLKFGAHPFFEQDVNMSCDECGTGQLIVKNGIRPNIWCDTCGLPKKRCKCLAKKDWADI